MHIHEYQAKALMHTYNIPVPKGYPATTPDEALAGAKRIGQGPWVVKAQIYAGGRGKGGGIKVCQTLQEVAEVARRILGMQLITPQTGPKGKKVRLVYVEAAATTTQELYLAVTLDRNAQCLTAIVSPAGGVDIEEVAAATPERIYTTHLDQHHYLWPFQAKKLFQACGLSAEQITTGSSLLHNLVKLCVEKDCTQVEINPLALTEDGNFLALDAKLHFDPSALRRQPAIASLDDPTEGDPLERSAAELGVNYIRLNGNIGTMVNGAGLAMATMDAIKQAGGEPANFLDAGGGANEEMVSKGLEVMLSDPQVQGVLINIFGGILRCDIVAKGLINALRTLATPIPVVVRMEGTNVAEARALLQNSGLSLHTATTIIEAATLATRLAQEAS